MLSVNKVSKIKADITAGLSQPEIAKRHKVSRSEVSDIATGRRHADVEWPTGEPVPKRAGGQRNKKQECDPTNERILELEADVVHLTEERNRASAKFKASAKTAGLFKAIVKEMETRIRPMPVFPPLFQPREKATIVEHVVMHLSDGHHDQVIRPEECGGLEEYNFPISCARAERYVNTVVEWTQDTLAPKFYFPVLTVLAYGDHTSGEIHNHTERSYYRNIFRNSYAIGQLHALMFRELAAYFEQVNVVYVPGNHGRRTPKKDHHGAHDNWDYLVAEVTRLLCQKNENISFLIPDAFSVNIDINGVGFNVSHGDDVRGNMGIPFYGMVRRQKGLIALGAAQGGPRVRYFVMGHHHVAASLSDIDGEMIVNGAWPGTDAYAFNSFAGYREPTQWLHGVNPKHGVTWRMAVKLKHDAEKRGPKRYKFDAGRDVGPII